MLNVYNQRPVSIFLHEGCGKIVIKFCNIKMHYATILQYNVADILQSANYSQNIFCRYFKVKMLAKEVNIWSWIDSLTFHEILLTCLYKLNCVRIGLFIEHPTIHVANQGLEFGSDITFYPRDRKALRWLSELGVRLWGLAWGHCLKI